MCQGRLIDYNQCPTLLGDVDGGGDRLRWGAGDTQQISQFSAQSCCESTSSLKSKVNFFFFFKGEVVTCLKRDGPTGVDVSEPFKL